jgi:polyhydroxyalkanoate synthase
MATNEKEKADTEADEIVQILHDIAERSRGLVEDFLARQTDGVEHPGFSPMQIGGAFLELTTRLMTNPVELAHAQFQLWQDYVRLWQGTTQRLMGQEPEPVIRPERGDRRFKDEAWNDNLLFDFIKQSYLLSARYLQQLVSEHDGLDDKTRQKVEFYTRQFVDALAPSNFVLTNPEVLQRTLETRGENLLRGLKNMLDDLDRGKGSSRSA